MRKFQLWVLAAEQKESNSLRKSVPTKQRTERGARKIAKQQYAICRNGLTEKGFEDRLNRSGIIKESIVQLLEYPKKHPAFVVSRVVFEHLTQVQRTVIYMRDPTFFESVRT